MTEEEIYSYRCNRCSKIIPCSEGYIHYIKFMQGAKILCHDCQKEYEKHAAKFFEVII